MEFAAQLTFSGVATEGEPIVDITVSQVKNKKEVHSNKFTRTMNLVSDTQRFGFAVEQLPCSVSITAHVTLNSIPVGTAAFTQFNVVDLFSGVPKSSCPGLVVKGAIVASLLGLAQKKMGTAELRFMGMPINKGDRLVEHCEQYSVELLRSLQKLATQCGGALRLQAACRAKISSYETAKRRAIARAKARKLQQKGVNPNCHQSSAPLEMMVKRRDAEYYRPSPQHAPGTVSTEQHQHVTPRPPTTTREAEWKSRQLFSMRASWLPSPRALKSLTEEGRPVTLSPASYEQPRVPRAAAVEPSPFLQPIHRRRIQQQGGGASPGAPSSSSNSSRRRHQEMHQTPTKSSTPRTDQRCSPKRKERELPKRLLPQVSNNPDEDCRIWREKLERLLAQETGPVLAVKQKEQQMLDHLFQRYKETVAAS